MNTMLLHSEALPYSEGFQGMQLREMVTGNIMHGMRIKSLSNDLKRSWCKHVGIAFQAFGIADEHWGCLL